MYLFGAGIFGLGTPELIIIAVILLVLFGPKQIPKLGRMFGSTMKEVKSGIDEATKELQSEGDADASNAGCTACGAELAPGAAFCNSCGAEQVAAIAAGCISCGAELAPGAAFCNECGAQQEKKADA